MDFIEGKEASKPTVFERWTVLAVSNSADSWAMSSNGGPSWPPFAVI
jgi:hypothetical protein